LNKSCELAGILLEMAGLAEENEGKKQAKEILKSGKAYNAMKRIMQVQGGNPEIKPEDIKVGTYVSQMKANESGIVTKVENKHVNKIAKLAGCPGIKVSGVEIGAKIGEPVQKGDILFTIYSNSEERLQDAVEYYNLNPPQILGGMTLEKI
jgi:AMP phosphorylase